MTIMIVIVIIIKTRFSHIVHRYNDHWQLGGGRGEERGKTRIVILIDVALVHCYCKRKVWVTIDGWTERLDSYFTSSQSWRSYQCEGKQNYQGASENLGYFVVHCTYLPPPQKKKKGKKEKRFTRAEGNMSRSVPSILRATNMVDAELKNRL